MRYNYNRKIKKRAGVIRPFTYLELIMQDMIDDYRRQIGEFNKRIDELNKEINGIQSKYNKEAQRLHSLIAQRDNLVGSLQEMLYGVERRW